MESDNRKPIVQVLHSSVILIRLLVCSFCWLTNTFVYYGLSLNSVAFAGDKYINFVLVAVVEIPGYCLTWLLTDYIGRKLTLSGSFLLSGVFCLAIQFIPTGRKENVFPDRSGAFYHGLKSAGICSYRRVEISFLFPFLIKDCVFQSRH